MNLTVGNVFETDHKALDREFSLYSRSEDRTSDKSSETLDTLIGKFYGSEPQLIQRVTTNLLSIAEEEAMQIAPFKVYTDETDLVIEKNSVIQDPKTGKKYRVIVPYLMNGKYDLTVTELND